MSELDQDTLWRRCERAWGAWLSRDPGVVVRLADATSNTEHSGAPLIQVGERLCRAPDYQVTRDGRSVYWEVKCRSRSTTDPNTGQRQHWMTAAAFDDYLTIQSHASVPTIVVLYEAATATAPGRWLQIDLDDLREVGTQEHRWVGQGRSVPAWVWPVAAMTVIDGPVVDESLEGDVAPSDGGGNPVDITTLVPVERDLRRRRRARSAAEVLGQTGSAARTNVSGPDRLHEWLGSERADALDVLRRSLGIPTFPRYSVVRVGLNGVDVDDLLGLLHYGIRLVVLSDRAVPEVDESTALRAFREARLLECAVVPEAAAVAAGWAVDGAVVEGDQSRFVAALEAADRAGQINYAQYRIVHAPPGQDVVVRAGAGTGKTETMAERIVFLLSVSGAVDSDEVNDLRADEIALVTFTRDAASQMRARVGLVLLLRQRLCEMCVQPVLAWMMQLAGAEIVTIHTLASRIVSSSAGLVGLGPDVRVGEITMDFREALQRNLTDDLTRLVEEHPRHRGPGVPPVHEWQNHVTKVWSALENNGVDLLRLASDGSARIEVDWGHRRDQGREAEICAAVTALLKRLADDVRDICLDQQVITTNQLVPTAKAALLASRTSGQVPPVRRYRHLFVDEFQDTDPSQMDLFLELRVSLGLRLFVVGDVKQGIYRFRGASGDAFTELETRAGRHGLPVMREYPLNRNFRTGERLLDSLDAPFSRWGQSGWLPYDLGARLQPRRDGVDGSRPLVVRTIGKDRDAQEAAAQVERWVEGDPSMSIAVLCRQNWQALAVQKAVREQRRDDPIACDARVGGSLYQSEAARELRTFLACVADHGDDAELLQLCETRWGAALASSSTAPPGVSPDDWGTTETASPERWSSRLFGLTRGALPRSDLEALRKRVLLLGSLTSRLPILSWLVSCHQVLAPECFAGDEPDSETERWRYARCLDRLVVLMDAHLGEAPLSLERLLRWLTLQVATNNGEDEPHPESVGQVTALTVHKAKGLEFDRVVVPWTWTRFGPPRTAETRVAVRHSSVQGPPCLSWRWGRAGDQHVIENRPVADREWSEDDVDTVKEEARLLYVAMTRARSELIVLDQSGQAGGGATPVSWHDLLTGGA